MHLIATSRLFFKFLANLTLKKAPEPNVFTISYLPYFPLIMSTFGVILTYFPLNGDLIIIYGFSLHISFILPPFDLTL